MFRDYAWSMCFLIQRYSAEWTALRTTASFERNTCTCQGLAFYRSWNIDWAIDVAISQYENILRDLSLRMLVAACIAEPKRAKRVGFVSFTIIILILSGHARSAIARKRDIEKQGRYFRYAVIHSGRHRHGAEDISGGVRTNLIVNHPQTRKGFIWD